MFTSLRPDSNLKHPATFLASLCLHVAVLVVLCGGLFPQISGPSIRPSGSRSASFTPIYFHKDGLTIPGTPEPAPATSHQTPDLPTPAPSVSEQEGNAADSTDEASGKDAGQGVTPFPSWSMNSMPSGFSVFGHRINTALPVFTPDPPIMHGDIPELARGKDVVLDVVINDQGSIVRVEVLQAVGYGVEDSIFQTLRRWIFVPAKFNGVGVASHRQLRFHFPS